MPPFDNLDPETFRTLALAVALVGTVLTVIVFGLLLRRHSRRQPRRLPAANLAIYIDGLGQQGPPASGPAVELYHLPMRVAALVVAPLGRGSDVVDEDRLPAIADQLAPGLGLVVQTQQPLVRLWPVQFSAQGFANTFFSQVRLPADKGKNTPWCALAGRFEADGQKLLAGVILRGAANNNLSQIVVERESQWIDLLRVRPAENS